MPAHLTDEQLARAVALRDLTDPAAGRHALQVLVDLAAGALTTAWGCPARHCTGPRVVEVADNYDHLGFTPDAASRDARYTRYVDDRRMLRSHASAIVPPALRALAAEPVDDVLLVCPGIVYRRDAIDRLHTGTPHQLDLWRISRQPLDHCDLDAMLAVLLDALLPGTAHRSQRRVHPYTVGGRQVDVDAEGRWVELWECGIAHPAVLADAGLPGWHGLALGMGLDRLLMLRKDIPDIRLLRSDDPRVADQMLDLAPYRPVSALPAASRDLSVAVDGEDRAEDLGDRVREALGEDAAAVEEVCVLAETPYDELPPAAVGRLGMASGQKNVLVRVVLRPLERTLSPGEANVLRDRVHAALHRGRVHQWAAPPP